MIDVDALIDEEYEKITKDMFDEKSVSYLYGRPLDRNNLKQMVVAAYCVGVEHEWKKSLERMKEAFDWSRK